ncbi:unnamed protein product [Fusarium equiseti]|uniref:Secreted LysM effector LysM C-terminal domain-containing protein n=1 Tax=Fusarium equiseti TaxID=61235 RepID=A0A8J2NE85_FUSEQ|nr:unnamed protein product [Fusarium equiseti]
MHFSASTSLAVLLAVMTPVSAWRATFYDQWFCNPKDDTQYRSISGDTDGACYIFGKDMPGTACEKFTNGGVNKGACDGEAFVPQAVLVQPGTACEVFADDNCEVAVRRYWSTDGYPYCGVYDAGIGFSISPIKSFHCLPSSNTDNRGRD